MNCIFIKVIPSKYANAELMKIPNFLHLTPPVIKKHCAALRKFCTAWPEGLDSEDQINKHFPLQVMLTRKQIERSNKSIGAN